MKHFKFWRSLMRNALVIRKILYTNFLTLFLVLALYIPTNYAQEIPNLNLPDGAITRLGKGIVNDIDFAADGTSFAAATSIGIWLFDAISYQTITLLRKHNRLTTSVLVQKETFSRVLVEIM